MTKKERKHIINQITKGVLQASVRFNENGDAVYKKKSPNYEVHYTIIGFFNPIVERELVFITKGDTNDKKDL